MQVLQDDYSGALGLGLRLGARKIFESYNPEPVRAKKANGLIKITLTLQKILSFRGAERRRNLVFKLFEIASLALAMTI
jgi:hypothetical protein